MNPFNLSNIKKYGFPLLLSFLGFFIGYIQKTNAELEGIHQEMTGITNRTNRYSDTLQRIENKVDGLTAIVSSHTQEILRHSQEIERINIRVRDLEGKGTEHK